MSPSSTAFVLSHLQLCLLCVVSDFGMRRAIHDNECGLLILIFTLIHATLFTFFTLFSQPKDFSQSVLSIKSHGLTSVYAAHRMFTCRCGTICLYELISVDT